MLPDYTPLQSQSPSWKQGLTGAARRRAKRSRHQRACQRRAENRKSTRKRVAHHGEAKKKPRRKVRESEVEHTTTGAAVHVCFPANLDLVNNYTETATSLSELRKHICDFPAQLVHIDHSKIEKSSPEVVLILLAEMMRADSYSPNCLKMGTPPKSVEGAEILWKTGYMSHFRQRPATSIKSTKEYLQYTTHNKRKQRVAKRLVDHFTPACGFDKDTAKALKVAIAECMDNVLLHAYKPHRPKQLKDQWWMLGYRDQTTHECYFCFYDQGNSIPGTIRVRFKDTFPLMQPTDSEMIYRGMEGRYSRTKDAGRGTGLPTLMEFIESAKDGELLILSGKGRYCFHKGKLPEYADTDIDLPGTLIVWTIRT